MTELSRNVIHCSLYGEYMSERGERRRERSPQTEGEGKKLIFLPAREFLSHVQAKGRVDDAQPTTKPSEEFSRPR